MAENEGTLCKKEARLSHPFGDLLSQHLHRKHGLSQSKLAAGILQDPAIIGKMCKGERLSGPQARGRVLAIIDWLRAQGALTSVAEANALLRAAGKVTLHDGDPLEVMLLQQLDAVPEVILPLVGRQPEWQALHAAWHGAAAGTAHCVLIAGEAGIGKTRLAEEVLQWADRQGYATARTRSYAAEGRLAYAPITEWLRSNAIRARLPELEPVWLVEVARLLPELLVERPDLPPPAPLADSWQRQRFRQALVRAFLLVRQPLLLVIDDLQWCDNETLEWIHYLLRFAAQEPLLVIGTVRPEEVGSDHPLTTLLTNLRYADQLTDIELGLLSSAETATLASQIAGGALSHDQSVALYTQTEGHPLFVVEMLRAKGKKGTVSEQAALPASFSFSPKLQAVIRSRLAQLSPSAHELVALAATVGRAFTMELLAQASAADEDTLVRALDELWQRRLIREQGESSYDFSHDRIREAAYTSVSSARRRLLHRRVAQALQQIYAADLDTISGELANHYEQAGLAEQAIFFYQQAARVAQHIYAHAEASSHLVKGLGLLEKLPVTTDRLQQELRLRLSLGNSLTVLKGVSAAEAKEEYARAQELAMQVGDNPDRFDALLGLFVSNLAQGHLQVAHDLAKQRLTLAEQVRDQSERARACGSLGVLHLHLGHWMTSRIFLEQALDWANEQSLYSASLLRVQHLGVSYQRYPAITLWHLGYPDQALQQMDEALARAHDLAHPYTSASIHIWSAQLYVFRREAPLAQARAETTIALSLEHGFPFWLEQGNILLGWALAQQGQVEAGIARIQRSLDIRETMEAHLHKPAFLALLVEVYDLADQPEQGLHLLDDALDAVEASGERWSEAEIYRLKGELLRMQGADACEVESHFLHALAIARQQEAKSLELRAAMSLCRLWQQQGRPQEAHTLLAGIYGWFTEGFSSHDLVEARALLDELS